MLTPCLFIILGWGLELELKQSKETALRVEKPEKGRSGVEKLGEDQWEEIALEEEEPGIALPGAKRPGEEMPGAKRLKEEMLGARRPGKEVLGIRELNKKAPGFLFTC